MSGASPRLPARSDFLKLWGGQAASLFGSCIGRFAYDLAAILTLHASPSQMAILNGCILVPPTLAGPGAGLLADRVRRRPLLVGSDLGRGLALASIPLAALFHTLTMLQLDIVAALVSTLTILFDVSYQAYLPSVVGPENIIEANSKLRTTAAVAEAGGSGIAGLLVQLFTAPMVIAGDAVSFAVSALSLASLRNTPEAHLVRAHEAHWWCDLREGIGAIHQNQTVRVLALTAFAWDLVGSTIGVVILLFFVRNLHLAPLALGPLFGIGGISAVVGALLAQRVVRRFGLGCALIASLYFNNVGLLAVIVAGGPLALVLFLVGLEQTTDGGRAIYEIHSMSLVQRSVPLRLVGRVSATILTLRSAAMVIGLVLGGVLGQTVGLRPTLILALAGNMIVPLLLAFSPIRTLREAE